MSKVTLAMIDEMFDNLDMSSGNIATAQELAAVVHGVSSLKNVDALDAALDVVKAAALLGILEQLEKITFELREARMFGLPSP